jgi:hypothetical protein
MRRILIITLIVATQIFAAPLTPEKDIEIMESILNKIIIEESPLYFSYNDKFNGNYYEDFGILLHAESSGFFDIKEQMELILPESRVFLYLDENGKDLLLEENEKDRDKILEKRKKEMEELKAEKQQIIDDKLRKVITALEDFFINYTRVAVSMKDDEKIAVNIQIHQQSGEKEMTIPAFIKITATTEDLKKYYTGKYDEDKMKKKLVIETPNKNFQKKDVEVMCNIFDTFLEKQQEFWNKSNKTAGFYIEGYGAIFNIPVTGKNIFPPITINTKLIQEKVEKAQKQMEKSQEKLKKFYLKFEQDKNDTATRSYNYSWTTNDSGETAITVNNNFDSNLNIDVTRKGKNELITFGGSRYKEAEMDSLLTETREAVMRTLSIYGPTLKSIQTNEKININITTGSKTISLVCRKKDIEDYNSGKIDYKKFLRQFDVK